MDMKKNDTVHVFVGGQPVNARFLTRINGTEFSLVSFGESVVCGRESFWARKFKADELHKGFHTPDADEWG